MDHEKNIDVLPAPTDFGDEEFPSALVTITNACNLRCAHCFVYREDTPSEARDKMNDATMLHQLRILRDKHNIRSMLFFGGEPMIKKDLVFEGMKLFESSSIVTNGTYGIPSVPGHLVTVSLDGPKEANDAIRGEGVFDRVREAVFDRDPTDGTIVMLQMAVTKQNAPMMEDFLEEVKDWPVNGVAFTFYVPDMDEESDLAWSDLKERDVVIQNLIELKKRYPLVKANAATLELMMSDRCLESTGVTGENCRLKNMLPLYVGDGGNFERTFCCYGNNVDCSKCGAYAVFNSAYHHKSIIRNPGQ
jgi:Fe-coproporphyrin III synthase